MRLSKFLAIVALITCFSLLYVYQQTEIFRFAYLGQNKQAAYEDLLDKNSILRYNIKNYTSLVNIGHKISRTSEFEIPNSYRLVRLAPLPEGLGIRQAVNRETILSRIFGIKRQAEAKTINP